MTDHIHVHDDGTAEIVKEGIVSDETRVLEPTRLVEMSTEVFANLALRDWNGRALSVVWGDPVAKIGGRDIYEPLLTSTDDGMVLISKDSLAALERVREAAEWLCAALDGGPK